jgi:hypothetical protein
MATTRKKVTGKMFAAELRNTIDDVYEGNMAEYSRASGVASGTLGHYLSTNRYPSPERLAQLLKPLQGKAKQRLLESFLLDLVPAEVRPLVKLSATGTGTPAVKGAKLDPGMGVSDRTLSALDFLGRLAAESPAVRTMIEQTAKAMGWS